MNHLKINILYFALFFLLWVLATLLGVYIYMEYSGMGDMIISMHDLLEDATLKVTTE